MDPAKQTWAAAKMRPPKRKSWPAARFPKQARSKIWDGAALLVTWELFVSFLRTSPCFSLTRLRPQSSGGIFGNAATGATKRRDSKSLLKLCQLIGFSRHGMGNDLILRHNATLISLQNRQRLGHWTVKILAFVLLLATTGCAHRELLSGNRAEAINQVQTWVPAGTSVADAIRQMDSHGFDTMLVEHGGTYLDCEYRSTGSIWNPVLVCAHVSFSVVDGKVSEMQMSHGLKGP